MRTTACAIETMPRITVMIAANKSTTASCNVSRCACIACSISDCGFCAGIIMPSRFLLLLGSWSGIVIQYQKLTSHYDWFVELASWPLCWSHMPGCVLCYLLCLSYQFVN